MSDIILIIVGILNIVIIILLIAVLSSVNQNRNSENIKRYLQSFEKNQNNTDILLRDEMHRNREEVSIGLQRSREELGVNIEKFNNSLMSNMSQISNMQRNQLQMFSDNLSKLFGMIEGQLKELREDNTKKLEEMRVTVDEKLNSTLEKRLGESFRLVSERLELVHKGLGEMQSLASGVGDLKKILSNVKTRGTWGEMQLGNILEQILTIEQYSTNVVTKKGSSERVEFAIKLPGREKENDKFIYMPVDSKFPVEDYQRLMEAGEAGDVEMEKEAAKALEVRIKACAKDIKEKYIDPPNTTDFGIMFLPIEGLYAEVLRRPGLCEKLQADYRIIVTGPTTLTAILSSLQIGFRTLAIEKRSSQVWELLGVVKGEFTKFGDILEKTQKKLQEASNTIETAAKKSRNIERKLKGVQTINLENEDTEVSQVTGFTFDDNDD